MKFTIRQLEYFIAAAEMGSITLASARVNISQPSISTAISQLEHEFGVQLFIRHHAQGLSLTPSGRALLRDARELVKRAENLYAAVADSVDSIHGVLSVGCMVTLAAVVMPELTQSFCRKFPQADIRQVDLHQEALLAALRRGDIDVAVTYDLELTGDIAFTPFVSLPPFAVVGDGHVLSRRRSVGLRDLAPLPMVLLDLPLTRSYFLSLFAQERLTPTIRSRSPYVDVVRAMVGNGQGYTLLNAWPRCEQAPDGSVLRRVRLAGDHAPMVLGIATLRQLEKTRIVGAFEAHCRESISDAQVPGMVRPLGRRGS